MPGYKLHNEKKEVLIIGDIVLDCYIESKRSYASNEKINKLMVRKKTYIAGNAANVANNLARLDITVHLYGLAGNDVLGNKLETLLDPSIKSYISKSNNRTPLKMRYLDERKQALLRVDDEEYADLTTSEYQFLISLFDKLQDRIGYLIISDLNKGTFSDAIIKKLINKARKANILVLIDPSGSRPNSCYSNADFLFPNIDELEKLQNQKFNHVNEAITIARGINRSYQINYILLKADKFGSFFVNHNNILHIPASAKNVICEVGAGDSYIAGFVYSLITHRFVLKSFIFANLSAAISISKDFTAVVEKEELETAYRSIKVDR